MGFDSVLMLQKRSNNRWFQRSIIWLLIIQIYALRLFQMFPVSAALVCLFFGKSTCQHWIANDIPKSHLPWLWFESLFVKSASSQQAYWKWHVKSFLSRESERPWRSADVKALPKRKTLKFAFGEMTFLESTYKTWKRFRKWIHSAQQPP